MRTIIYFKNINTIGGVESWLYYLSKLYDCDFYYKEGDPTQIERLAKNIRVRKYKNDEKLVCDRFIVNYNPDIIDNVDAKEYIMMIHCDYSHVSFKPITNPKFTKYIGVSQYVCDVFTSITGIPCECMYNPVVLDPIKVDKKEGIHVISATRLTSEKGMSRIENLSRLLDNAGVKYMWDVYTNKNITFRSPNITVKPPKLDLSKEIAESTWLVQLSDAEAFCYSVVESLILGTKVIVTDLPVYKELGIDLSYAVICDLNMTNVDIDRISAGYGKFKYTPPKSDWGKYLSKEKKYDKDKLVDVKLLVSNFNDVYEKRHFEKSGVVYSTPEWRASCLEAKGYVSICE